MPTASAAAFSSSTRFMDARATRVLFAEPRSAGSWWDSAGRTTVRSASVVENLIGHQRGCPHLQHIVDAHHVSAVQDGSSHCRGGGALHEAFRWLLYLR